MTRAYFLATCVLIINPFLLSYVFPCSLGLPENAWTCYSFVAYMATMFGGLSLPTFLRILFVF